MYRGCYVLYNFHQEAGRASSFGPTKEKRPGLFVSAFVLCTE
jgi:hypothetical protein